MPSGHRIAELSWPQVRPLLEAGATAILPVGAAAKEHGPHMPMSADWLQAEALGVRLCQHHAVVVWPTVGYGFYPAFVEYPGSTSIGRDTFAAVISDLVRDLFRAGAPRTLILNTGISTIAPIEAAVASSTEADRTATCHVYRGERYLARVAEICEQRTGGHADEAETSILLSLCPGQVDLSKARPWERRIPPGRFRPDDREAPGYSPDGVTGDPTLATAAKGDALVSAMLEDVAASLTRLEAGR